MDVTRLGGSKRKIYNILNSTDDGVNVINILNANRDIIVGYSTIAGLKANNEKLKKLLDVIFDGVAAISKYLIRDRAPAAVGDDTMKKTFVKVDKITTDAKKDIDNFLDANNYTAESIKNFVEGLDKHYSLGDKGQNLIIVGIFKQIYSMMYNFILGTLGRKRKGVAGPRIVGKSNIAYASDDSFYIPQNMKAKGEGLDRTTKLTEWMMSKWNWRLGICCIDKLIHVYNHVFIPVNFVDDSLPLLKYLSSVLGCSAEAFLGCYDVGYLKDENKILRTSKYIKNDGTGYYLYVKPYNKGYNFNNLLTKTNNSEKMCWYKVFINGETKEMSDIVKAYNTIDDDGMDIENGIDKDIYLMMMKAQKIDWDNPNIDDLIGKQGEGESDELFDRRKELLRKRIEANKEKWKEFAKHINK